MQCTIDVAYVCWRRQILAKIRNSPNSPNIIARQNLLIYSKTKCVHCERKDWTLGLLIDMPYNKAARFVDVVISSPFCTQQVVCR